MLTADTPHPAFHRLHARYPASGMPFLRRMKSRVARSRPYTGLRILHNVPLTGETVLKIEVLALGGAELVVTSPTFVEPDPESVDVLREAGVEFRPDHDFAGDFDVTLDCGGELFGLVTPRLGAGELTGTGTTRYRAADPRYPVVAVDESRVKDLEALLGTGRSFRYAFEHLVPEPIADKPFLVFGYGKVGKGIVRALRERTDRIGVVERNPRARGAAADAGCDAIRADDAAAVEAWARQAFAVVTATGSAGVVSAYDAAAFRGRYLANMGAEDEFGTGFTTDEVLHGKNPVNFAVSAPDSIKYLDPVFYAHNLVIDLLQFARLAPGVHSFPDFLASEIVTDWQKFFDEHLELD